MVYLAIYKINTPPSPQLVDAIIAQCEYCEDLRKKGQVTLFSPYADFSGGISILNVNSPQDAMKIVAGGPIFPYVRVELQPLVCWQFSDEMTRHVKAGMAAAR